jgi:DNA-binding Lrp family transcriptional regulator
MAVDSMTELDLAIFRALQADGRIPFTALADRLSVSEAHVRRRVKALSQQGVIAITAVADPRVLGLESMAWVGLRVGQSEIESVAEVLVSVPEVDYVVISAGAFNVMAEVACASSDDLYALLLRIRELPGVLSTETFVYLQLLRQQFQWADADSTSAAPQAPLGVRSPPTALDRLDIELIRELQRDGRASFRDIAGRLKISERLLSARFAYLAEQGAVRVIAVGNPVDLGYHAMAWLGINLREGGDFEVAAAELSAVRRISYLVAASGRYDLMAEIVCRSREDLLSTLSDQIGRIEGIGHIDTFYYLRLLYRSAAGAWGAARSRAGGERGAAMTSRSG